MEKKRFYIIGELFDADLFLRKSLPEKRKTLLRLAALSFVLLSFLFFHQNEERKVAVSYRRIREVLFEEVSEKTISRWFSSESFGEFLKKSAAGYSFQKERAHVPVFEVSSKVSFERLLGSGILVFEKDAPLEEHILWRGKTYRSLKECTDAFFGTRKKTISEYREAMKTIRDTSLRGVPEPIKESPRQLYALLVRKEKGVSLSHQSRLNLDILRALPLSEQRQFSLSRILSDADGWMRFFYYRSENGRYYLSPGLPFQRIPSGLRRSVFSDYYEVDISMASFFVLREYGKRIGVSLEEYPEICSLLASPQEYRKSVYHYFKECDPELSEEYMKTILNGLVYGGRLNEPSVLREYFAGTRRSFLLRTKGYSDFSVPLSIAGDTRLKELGRELREYGKKLIEKSRSSGVLLNASGLELSLKEEKTYGQKITHLYQGMESLILKKVSEIPVNGVPLIEQKRGVGLLLHDGIYVHASLKPFLTEETIETYLKKENIDVKLRIK